MKRLTSLFLTLTVFAAALAGCGQTQTTGETPDTVDFVSADKTWEGAVTIELSDEGITVDGETASTDASTAVYIANDIVYYEEGKDFTYGEGTEEDAHSAEEAAAHTVVHITQPGRYVLSGKLPAGQVAVDLGEDAEEDPNAVVTLILNGVHITNTVAPGIIFYNVYECGSKDTEKASKDVDTSAAGANVLIADGSTNVVNGSYVARIYKPDSVVLNEDGTEVEDAKKLHKYDAAFYSKMSMNVDGEASGASNMDAGVLYIRAENEGLDSELHLTINGGIIDITSGNDGINTNEDGVSVTTINGGNLAINVDGETGEGDGIDSNGWLVINGGTVVAAACSDSQDAGIDSDMGIHINGGFVMASGNMLDRIEDGGQNYVVLSFAQQQLGGTACSLKAEDGGSMGTFTPANNYSILLVSNDGLSAGTYTLWQGDTQLSGSPSGGVGGMMGGGARPGGTQVPTEMENFDPSALPEPPAEGETGERPEGMEPPEGMERPEGQEGHQNFQMNEDGTITLPDGTMVDPSEMTPPDGQGGVRPGRGQMGGGEQITEFEISDGGNIFGNIAAKT